MTGPVEAVIFDLDNTLVRSKVDFAKMRRRIIGHLRCRCPDLTVIDAKTTIELVDKLRFEVSEEELPRLMEEIHEIMNLTEMEAVNGSSPMADLPLLFRRLKETGLRLGLLTRSCRAYTRAVLGDLIQEIDAIACREAGAPAKPDPRALVSLARQLDAHPSRTVLVGDHLTDGICAERAGAMFVGMATGSSQGAELSKLPHVAILQDLADLPDVLEKIMGGSDHASHRPTHIFRWAVRR